MGDLQTLRYCQKVFQASFSSITSDQLLSIFRSEGLANQGWLNIGDVDWERIVIDIDVTGFSGTSVTFKLKTLNNPQSSTAVTATTLDAKDPAGTNVTKSGVAAVGRSITVVGRTNANTTTGYANIGKYIGLYADVTSLTKLNGSVAIYVGK